MLIKAPAAPFHVLTVQIPTGDAHGWAKIDALTALRQLVTALYGVPLILSGDFNEPRWGRQEGRIVTGGQERGPDGRYRCWDSWTGAVRSGTGQEWDRVVRWFFEAPEASPLRHAYWEVARRVALACTQKVRGKPREVDHVFVSS